MSDPSLIYNTIQGPFASQELVDAALGPLFVGGMVNLIFWGVAASAFLNYTGSARFSTDTIRTKLVVYSVSILATTQSAFHFWSLYHYATCQARDADTLFSQTFVDCFAAFWVGFEAAIVQVYLAMRAALLFESKRNKIIFYSACGVGILLGLVGSNAYLVLSFMDRAGTLQSALIDFNTATSLWLIPQAFVDLLISIVLIISLRKRMAGNYAATDNMLKQLIFLAIASASYTALFAVTSAILTLSLPKHSLYANAAFAFPLPLSSFYALSLFMNLSQGTKIRESGEKDANAAAFNKSNVISGFNNNRNPTINVVPVPVHFNSYEMDNINGDDDLKV